MAKQEKKPLKKAGSSPLTKLVILVLLGVISWQLYGMRAQLSAAQAERDRYEAEVEQLREENELLSADIAEGPTAEKMEEIARKELGVVTPGEYVFSHQGK